MLPILDKKKICKQIVTFEELNNNIKFNKKIFILGLGYVGLTLGLILAENNFDVIGYDKDQKLEKCYTKKKPFFENGLQEFLDEYINKNFKIINKPNYSADVHIISVGTPLKNGSKIPNMEHLKKAINIVCKNLKKNDLIILRSTVPIGTCRDVVIPMIEKKLNLNLEKILVFHFVQKEQLRDWL